MRKGANYGYSEREGDQVLQGPDNTMAALPAVDEIPVRVSDTVTNGTIVPTYPGHRVPAHSRTAATRLPAASSIAGKRCRRCRGKYVFADISTGRIWYADYKEMLAADDGNPATMAAMHDVQLQWEAPGRDPDAVSREYPTRISQSCSRRTRREAARTRTCRGPRRCQVPAARTSALASTPPASSICSARSTA